MKHITILVMTWIIVGLYFISPTKAALEDPLTTIELEIPVHFLAPDGSDLRAEAGTYTIEPAEEWIRLISGARHDALLIEATKGMHAMELEHTMGLSVPGETEEEKDLHHVMLLLPGGQSSRSDSGTYSGIRPRGFFRKDIEQRVKNKCQSRPIRKLGPRRKKPRPSRKALLSGRRNRSQQSAKKGITQVKKWQ